MSVMKAIIWAYRIIVESNTLVDSQRYTESEEIHDRLIRGRQCFQMLVRSAHQAQDGETEDNVETQGLGDPHQPLLPGSEEIIDEVIVEEIDENENENDEEEEEEPLAASVSFSVHRKRRRERQRSAKTKLQKLLGLPNVHAELHIAEMARKYATIMNCNVLVEELKHK